MTNEFISLGAGGAAPDGHGAAGSTSSAGDARPEVTLFGVKLSLFLFMESGSRLEAPTRALPYVGNIDLPCCSLEGGVWALTLIVDGETTPGKELSSSAADLVAMSNALTVNWGKERIRPRIHVVEVGSGASWSAEARWAAIKEKYANSLALVKMSVVDPARREVISNSAEHEAYLKSVLDRPVPTKAELASALAAQRRPSPQPWVSGLLIACLAGIFGLELLFGIGPTRYALAPNVHTLVAFGGISRDLVASSGDWSRLLTAMFLHVDPKHLLFNAYALFIGGSLLEGRIGRWHFLALYLLSGIGGALASIALNPANVVSVGASGAISGLFGGVMVLAQHYPPGPERSGIQMLSLQILIPSILPLIFTSFGAFGHIDFGAHLGGAIAGVLYGGLLLGVWPRRQALPNLVGLARGIVALMAVALAAIVPGKVAGIRTTSVPGAAWVDPRPQPPTPSPPPMMRTILPQLPDPPMRSVLPTLSGPAPQVAPRPLPGMELYPGTQQAAIDFDAIRDQINGASDLIVDGKYQAAERDLRDALSHEAELRNTALRPLIPFARTMLALALSGQHRDAEARSEAATICASTETSRRLLEDRKLCD